MRLKNILIINLGGIGDFLLSTPALRAIKIKYKDTNLSLLVVPRVSEIAVSLPYIDKVYIFKKTITGVFSNILTVYHLKRINFDIAINMRTIVSKSSARKIKLLLDFISPKIKIGRNTENRGYFFDIKIQETEKAEKYEMEYDIDAVNCIGVEVENKKIVFNISAQVIKRIDEMLINLGLRNKTIIGFHIGGMPSRRWPLYNFAKLMELLKDALDCQFVITGAKNEIYFAKKLLRYNRKISAINLAGLLNLEELAALIKRCSLFISNDTGPMHIAAILDIPLLALFGGGDVKRYDPRVLSKNAVVIHKKVPCAPCNNFICKKMTCLKMITPWEIAEEAFRILKNIL